VTRGIGAVVAALSLVFVASPGRAFSPILTATDTQAALAEGQAAAATHLGYPVAGYILYAVPDALLIGPGQGSIDAIVVGTPFERVRYASYLAAFQNAQAAGSAVAAAAAPDTVDFIVFAHSGARGDQGFLQRFHAVALEAHGHTLQPAGMTTFGPADDFFTTSQGKRVIRWLGYDTFRFDLRALALAGIDVARLTGRLNIVDPYGRRYDVAFDLSKYR